VYTPESISALFDDLRQEVQLVLLFLKSIRSIEVLQLLPGQTQPQLLFSCSVANADAALLQQRALFLHAASALADELVAGTYQLDMVLRCVHNMGYVCRL
jgi:sacsin